MASAVPLFNGLKHLPCPKEAGGHTCTTTGCLFGHRTDRQPSSMPGGQSLDGAADEDGLADGENGAPPSKRQKTAAHRPDEGVGEAEGEGEAENSRDGRQITNAKDILRSAEQARASELYDPLSPPVVGSSPRVGSLKAVTPSPLQKQTVTPRTRVSGSPAITSEPVTPVKSSATLTSAPGLAPSSTPRIAPSGLRATPASAVISPPDPPGDKQPASPRVMSQSASTTKVTPPSQKPAPVRKPESLNPRHLTAAPAAHSIRHKLLSLMHVELTRLNGAVSDRAAKDPQLKGLALSAQELIRMALDREQELATKRPAIYNNAMRQEVMKYKRMQLDGWVAERKQLLDKKPVQKNPSIGAPVTINTGLTTDQEIIILRRLVTPITKLEQYGYVPVPPTDEQIDETKQAVAWSQGWEQCHRCTTRFQVFPGRNIETGQLTSGGQCTHHPGKQYFPERQRGDTTWVPKKYRCCNQDVGESPGCTVGETHVWRTSDPKRLATLWKFAETPANESPLVREVVAFDCEMGYTVHGMELVRLTATSWPDGAELLDVLIQPYGEILDLNSRYSGVWPEDLAHAVPWTQDWTPSPQQPGERRILQKVSSPEIARDLLFSLIGPETILIGHGLENDLNAMRMVHPKLVDTVLLYPHRRGLPVRTGLKNLMETMLNRRIQVDSGEGHDSAEDARAAGDLARYKVEKEWTLMKSRGWKWVDGVLRAPGWKPTLQPQSSEESVDTAESGALLTEEFLEAES